MNQSEYVIYDFDLKADSPMTDAFGFALVFRDAQGNSKDRYPGDAAYSSFIYPFKRISNVSGKWTHITIVGDVANNEMYIYQDNKLIYGPSIEGYKDNNGFYKDFDLSKWYLFGARFVISSNQYSDPIVAGTDFAIDNNCCRITTDLNGLVIGSEDVSNWESNVFNADYVENSKTYSTGYDDYFKFTAPSNSGDYAYWSGTKVVRAPGTTKDEVKWMQAALNYCITHEGLDAQLLEIDGSFGPKSKTVTTKFQKMVGLKADGSFGPDTIKKMKAVLEDQGASFDTGKEVSEQSKMLEFDMELIKKVGYQAPKSKWCACYALAYCRTILDGKVQPYSNYSVGWLPKVNRYSYDVDWSKGNYTKVKASSTQALYKTLYDSINEGKPIIVHVKGNGSDSTYGHWIAVVGYKNVTDPNNLSSKNFLIIDSVKSAFEKGIRLMSEGSSGYTPLDLYYVKSKK